MTSAKITGKRRDEIIDKLKLLDGLPPHDGMNPCRGDGYFAKSIERDFGASLADLRKMTGYDDVAKRIRAMMAKAARIK